MRLFVRNNTDRSLLAGFFLAFFATASAQDLPPIIGCSDNGKGKNSTAELAILTLSGTVSNTWETCPLLEETEPFKLVEKFGETTLFAYDFGIPFTCFSGDVSGTLTYSDGEHVSVEGVALSAQRLFPVPDGQDIPPGTGFGLVANSILGDLGAGAAMTWVQFDDNAVLLDDHFLASASPGVVSDTEDFLIVGASGSIRLSGRLAGRGTLELGIIPGTVDQTFVQAIVFEEISGFVCVR